ncbi:MAG: hypothetical protein ABI639_01335 [Thermoanaerobaculia bacterium]
MFKDGKAVGSLRNALGIWICLVGFAWVLQAHELKEALPELVSEATTIQTTLAADSIEKVAELAAGIAQETGSYLNHTTGKEKADYAAIAVAAKGMTGSDLKTLREQFKPLALVLSKLVAENPQTGVGIYYCPMADAYWLQKTGEVKNPFFGSKMLACGEPVTRVGE